MTPSKPKKWCVMESRARTRTSVSEEPCAVALGRRLEQICDLAGGKKEAAALSGLSEDMLYRYCRAATRPPLIPLATLTEKLGVRLDWLAFGSGEMRKQETEPDAWSADLMQDVISETTLYLREMGVELSAERFGRVCVILYTLLSATKHEERPQALRASLRLVADNT